jgi:hypothetical protein
VFLFLLALNLELFKERSEWEQTVLDSRQEHAGMTAGF